MNNNRLRYLLNRYANGTATPEELEALSAFLQAAENDPQLELMIEEAWIQSADADGTLFSTLPAPIPARQHNTILRPVKRWYRPLWAAAVLLLLIAGGTWLLLNGHKKNKIPPLTAGNNPAARMAPGSNKATLTLASGATITLDSHINKSPDSLPFYTTAGQLIYHKNTGNTGQAISYNLLRTPKGGQYQLLLPDGSKVWLNAASSLKFPTAFTTTTRQVELSGEAYFEISNNARQPFEVIANNTNITVLGTRFNIMAYQNETAVKTTLLQGAVKVSRQQESRLLKPGEQSLFPADGDLQVIENADVELAVAWKNGFTSFRSADIRTIMRQVERWYDVEVVYNGHIPERTFTGDIPRDAQLTELLKLLEVSKIHFSMEGNQLVVMP
ncbi:FecR family protein [Chitinophaga nivalis]|uniref:FecR domain-containing protein n=1 Tax=Chitinophaga nivalis TaxID=2991709 RepID=A0ABT3IFF7_9BACT|nr:FecR family protein [Chitinophaga nivalis]MCW3467609.1 FecR domain-containing protein [Chitinophaga nivalis]MCW3482699.1 FecR domain-containing protein [Chitinophaga nivalis]